MTNPDRPEESARRPDGTVPPGGADDPSATRFDLPPAGGASHPDPDATRIGGLPATGYPPPVDPYSTSIGDAPMDPDATRITGPGGPPPRRPGVDATTVGPPGAPAEAVWTARAAVPPAGGASLRHGAPQQQWEAEEEDPYAGRSWFRPIAVGLVAFVLVALLGVGVWLIYRSTAGQPGTVADSSTAPLPSATPSVAPSSAEPSPTEAPSSAAPSSSAPTQVTVPVVKGDTQEDATAELRALGLTVVVVQREDASTPAGRVISSTPGVGETVAPGQTVTLIVAKAPAASPSRSTRSPSPSASGDD